MCHISIIYSVYVYHIFGNISMIGHMLWAVSRVYKIKEGKDEHIEIEKKISRNESETLRIYCWINLHLL